MTAVYITLDGSTRVGDVTDLPVLTKRGMQLEVPFSNAPPRALRPSGSIVSVFVGDKGWAIRRGAKRPHWRPLQRRVVRGRERWDEAGYRER